MKVTAIVGGILLTSQIIQAAEATFDLGTANAYVNRANGRTAPLDGTYGQVYDSSGCLPLKFSSFQIDVNAPWLLPQANTVIRMQVYTNLDDLTAVLPRVAYSYVVSSQSGLQWSVLTSSSFVGSSSLPPDAVPVSTNLVVVLSLEGYDGTTIQLQNVLYGSGRIEGGVVKKVLGQWVSDPTPKLALRLMVKAEQPIGSLPALKVVHKSDFFGPFLRVVWPRGLDGVRFHMKSVGPISSDNKFSDWYSGGVFSATDLWFVNIDPKDDRLPPAGMVFNLSR